MKAINQTASISQLSGGTVFDSLAFALGKLTGGMLPDGLRTAIADDRFSLLIVQAIFIDNGINELVWGAAPLETGETIVATASGNILKVGLVFSAGQLKLDITKATDEEAMSVSVIQDANEAIRTAVQNALVAMGELQNGNVACGYQQIVAHAAICRRLAATGRYLIRESATGNIRNGFEWTINTGREPTEEEAAACISMRLLTDQEVAEEKARQASALGLTSFPAKVGLA